LNGDFNAKLKELNKQEGGLSMSSTVIEDSRVGLYQSEIG